MGKRANSYKHGELINHKVSRLYRIWVGMIQRTDSPRTINFYNYGGRGITTCTEWHNSTIFCKWARENGYNDSLQIDRIDNEKGYNPDNCRFVTPLEQQANRRKREDWGIYKQYNRFIVKICRNYKMYYGGYHEDIISAKNTRDQLLSRINDNDKTLKHYKNETFKRSNN
jgi:hypothetical protein